MDLLMLAKVLWRKKWILILIPIVAGAAAYVFTMDEVNYFRSKAQIATGFTMNDQVQLSEEKFNARDAEVKFSNLLNSMTSAIPANLVVFRLLQHDLESTTPFRSPQLNASPEEVRTVREFLKKKLETFTPLSPTDPEYDLVRRFLGAYHYTYTSIKESMTIARVTNTDNVQIDFVSNDPNISAFAANAFCEEFIRYHKSMRTERTGESVEFLQQLMTEKKAALDEKLETQKMFKASNSLVDIQHESESKLGQLQALETTRDEIRSRIQRLELTIQRLNDEVRVVETPAKATNNNQKIIDLDARIRRLNERYITGGSSNPAQLDSLNSMREQMRALMEGNTRQTAAPTMGLSLAELNSRIKDAEIELKVERGNLNQAESKIRNIKYMASGFASKEAALEAIQKEIDIVQQEYLNAVNKFNEAKNRMLSSSTLRQVLLAAPAANPESSKRYLVIGLAAFSSLAICLFFIVGLELIDVSIRTPDKFKRLVNLPLVGMLNKIDSKNFNIRTYFNQATVSEETELYKSLLRKMRHEIENVNGKVILFTSPRKKDGKTFLMFSLSYVLSLINKRVLIIDTNFKNNSLSQLLVKPQTEIKVIEGKRVNLLIGSGKKRKEEEEEDDSDTDNNTYDLINPTRFKNIFIVGNAGGGAESPAEILSGRDFNNLIAVLVESFDYILLEGAALNDYSDTKELVQYADKVYAVFSAESAIKQLDKESILYFKSLGKKFGGAVLNRIDTKDLKL